MDKVYTTIMNAAAELGAHTFAWEDMETTQGYGRERVLHVEASSKRHVLAIIDRLHEVIDGKFIYSSKGFEDDTDKNRSCIDCRIGTRFLRFNFDNEFFVAVNDGIDIAEFWLGQPTDDISYSTRDPHVQHKRDITIDQEYTKTEADNQKLKDNNQSNKSIKFEQYDLEDLENQISTIKILQSYSEKYYCKENEKYGMLGVIYYIFSIVPLFFLSTYTRKEAPIFFEGDAILVTLLYITVPLYWRYKFYLDKRTSLAIMRSSIKFEFKNIIPSEVLRELTDKDRTFLKNLNSFISLEIQRLNNLKSNLRINSEKGDLWWSNQSGVELEQSVAKLLTRINYQTKLTKASGDGGVDIFAQRSDEEILVIQCKGWQTPVSVAAVRELAGVASNLKANSGKIRYTPILVATNGVTKSANSFCKSSNIYIWDSATLASIATRGEIKFY